MVNIPGKYTFSLFGIVPLMYEIMAFSKKSAHTVAMTMDKANGRKPYMHCPCTTHTVWEIIYTLYIGNML